MVDRTTDAARRPTLQDLADAVGVSKTTASNAFSRPDQLSPALRERVLAAAREAGYAGPHPAARMLRTGRTGALGLVFPETLPYAFDDQTAVALLQGIAEACEERRMGLFIVPGARNATDRQATRAAAVDGFVAYSLPRDTEALAAVLERRLPVVIVDQPALPGVPRVGIDDRAGATDAARHLLGLGHRAFGIVTLPCRADGYQGVGRPERLADCGYEVTGRRLAGYRAALADAGVDPEAVPVDECPRNDEDAGHDAGTFLLARSPRPTAILAMGDRLALGVLAAARELRLDVPAQLSVVGYDDIPAAARSRPSLTTVRQPLRLKGYAAARLILDAPRGGTSAELGAVADAPVGGVGRETDDGYVELSTELVVRQTTAVAPSRRRTG